MSLHIRPRRAGRLCALAAAGLLALTAACSGDDDGDDDSNGNGNAAEETPTQEPEGTEGGTESPPPVDEETAAELEAAVRAYTDAFFAPDAEAAYEMVSQRCRDLVDPEVYAAQLDQAAADHGQLAVETFTVEHLAGDEAHVTYTVGVPEFDERLAGQLWSRAGEDWKFDSC
ncbi:hypothetical protein [Streptomyces sp. MP131-18]|uniref:hypothetical protein n=1 Tax=Streptomyces sp. MP131-18 TaxID=1857892 RepID=UPI00097BCFCB|nr:hypothetical protein [Streptomyces sp. MP131-18]ONK14040.1 hypothetical protein STBA_48190 [Streptomyces sp. MP131-18]